MDAHADLRTYRVRTWQPGRLHKGRPLDDFHSFTRFPLRFAPLAGVDADIFAWKPVIDQLANRSIGNVKIIIGSYNR